MSRWTFTSESVTEGHPDKMADQISDAVLDAILAEDPSGRVACETLLTTGLAIVAGEITTEAYVDIPKIVRDTIGGIGYDRESFGFDGNTCGVMVSIDAQSPNIAQGVDTAVRDAHRHERRGHPQQPGRRRPGDDVRLRVRRDRRPHAAADLAGPPPRPPPVRGAQGRHPPVPASRREDAGHVRLRGRRAGDAASTVLISTQHAPGPRPRDAHQARPHGARHPPAAAPAVRGRRVRRAGQPHRHASSSAAPTPTRASPAARSSSTPTAAWPATAAARSRARTRRRSTARRPTRRAGSRRTSSPPARRRAARSRWRTPSASPARCRSWSRRSAPRRSTRRSIADAVHEVFDLRPAAIIRDLDLRRPIYKQTAAYGHFGRAEKEFTWEHTTRLDDMRSALGL